MSINKIWQQGLVDILGDGTQVTPKSFSGGGRKTLEIVGNRIVFDMKDPVVTVAERKMNFRFMFGEAAWICSGSNAVADITPYMKGYAKYSDDGVTLNGAYGPKFAEQMTWVVDCLVKDNDTRQAVLSIWRERPGPSKDVPCTITQQYLIRDGRLHAVVNMRSNDMVWGFCYDAFTFSMMAKMIQTLLRGRGVEVEMGGLVLIQGSGHIYEDHWQSAEEWSQSNNEDERWRRVFPNGWEDPKFDSREDLLEFLRKSADAFLPEKLAVH